MKLSYRIMKLSHCITKFSDPVTKLRFHITKLKYCITKLRYRRMLYMNGMEKCHKVLLAFHISLLIGFSVSKISQQWNWLLLMIDFYLSFSGYLWQFCNGSSIGSCKHIWDRFHLVLVTDKEDDDSGFHLLTERLIKPFLADFCQTLDESWNNNPKAVSRQNQFEGGNQQRPLQLFNLSNTS